MRADLLALTPEAVAALANLGLVKRALKELEQGKGPEIAEDADGVVTGAFPDGVTARLPLGVALRDAPCTCGAAAVCRHRVALALAYPAWAGKGGESVAEAEPVAEAGGWSPGEVDDEALRKRLGRWTFERAAALRRGGVTVAVRRPDRSDPAAAAELPSCTVRFLVPGDLAWARCDCVARQDCEHVALAVWAFRAADARDRETPRLLVEVAEERPSSTGGGEALDEAARLAAEILLDGAVHARPSLAPAFALCREGLRRAGQTWPFTLLEDLEEQLGAWQARSTRYEASRVAALLAELAARRRAAEGRGELPAPFVLGQGEALETRLDHLRLVSLGARVQADGRDREAEILLADPDTSTVLVLRKRWTFPEGEEPLAAPELAGRRAASGATLEGLAKGQAVTRVARRRANRLLVLGDARGGLTSVMPQAGAWDALPAPLRVTRLSDLEETWAERPPRLLRPRVLAEDVHVLAVASVEWIADLPGTQSLMAGVLDVDGHEILLRKPWRAVAPRALDALAAALSGAWGPVRFVSGEIRRHLGGFEMEPLAVACDRLVVPDLEKGPVEAPRLETARERADPPVESAAAEALGLLEEGAHHGLVHAANAYPDRLAAAARRLEGVGLNDGAARLRRLEAAMRAARSDGERWPAAAGAWNEAAIRLQLLREAA